jgi:hypothetical protein
MLQPWRGCSWLEVFGDHVLKNKAKSEGERQKKKSLLSPFFFLPPEPPTSKETRAPPAAINNCRAEAQAGT